jgi:hypothetical protein
VGALWRWRCHGALRERFAASVRGRPNQALSTTLGHFERSGCDADKATNTGRWGLRSRISVKSEESKRVAVPSNEDNLP